MLKIAALGRHVGALGDTPGELRSLLQQRGVAVRRINRFIELSLLGALHCRDAAGTVHGDAALYLAAEAPMLADCVKALRSTIAGQRPPTPFEFMNISGNMAGFYIAQQLAIGGPQLAVARRHAGLEAAFDLLQLQHRSHRRALLGCVEEGVWPLAEQRQRLQLPDDAPLHESSHWFYVDADCAAPLCIVAPTQARASFAEMATLLEALPEGSLLALHPRLDAAALDLPPALRRAVAPEINGQGATAEALQAYARSSEPAPWAHLAHGDDGLWTLLRASRPG
ncbi:MAG: hypothetical protein ACREVL_12880 [Solimonas sp.]